MRAIFTIILKKEIDNKSTPVADLGFLYVCLLINPTKLGNVDPSEEEIERKMWSSLAK